MRVFFLLSLLCLFLAACSASPSNSAVATAVEATLTARQQRQVDSGLPTAVEATLTARQQSQLDSGLPMALSCNSPEPNLGSYENPVPLNTPCAITFKTGENFTLTISQIIRGKPAWELLDKTNAWTEEAPKNKEWVCFYINMEFTDGPSSHDPFYFDDFWFTGVSNAFSTGGNMYEPPDPAFNVALYPGDKGKGWLCRTIFSDDTNPMVVFGPWQWDIGWYFSLVDG